MFELILIGLNLMVIVPFVFYLIKGIFGENALGRTLSLMGAIISFFGYFYIWDYVNYGKSMILGLMVFFGPISCAVLFLVIQYILHGNTKDNANTDTDTDTNTNEQSDN